MARGNPNPKPLTPRRGTATSPHMEGPGKSMIQIYNLTGMVREMRLKGKSYRAIADYINSNKLIPNGYVLSYNSVVRWCANNGLGGTIEATSDTEAVNTYNINCKLLAMYREALDGLQLRLDEANNNPGGTKISEYNKIVDGIAKMGFQIQQLTAKIGEMQEQVYRYETASKVIEIIMAKISVLLPQEDYEEIKAKLRDDPILCEALKTIAPSNV